MAVSTDRFRLRHDAEQAASGLPPLLVAAKRVATTVEQGVHGRRRVGLGETFWQFRQYVPGDSPRSIDWRRSARSSQVYIRETEWAAAQSVWLWRDQSPSMHYSSNKRLRDKREHADILTIALAALLVRAGERIALLDGDYRPSTGNPALDRLVFAIMQDDSPDIVDNTADLPVFQLLPRHSHLVLIGDFLAPLEEMDKVLRRFAARGVHGHLVQVLDPAEVSLPFDGRTRFEGLEGDGGILIKRVENIRDDYQSRISDHVSGLSDIARAIGWTHIVHKTDTPPEQTLLSLFVRLADLER